MVGARSDVVLMPVSRERGAARRLRRRAGILLVGLVIAAACGVAALGRGGSDPVVRVAAVGDAPLGGTLIIDDRTSRAFVFNHADIPNTVSVLDTETGAPLRTVVVGSQYAWLAADRPASHVFLSSYDGTISMFDARSGQLLRTVTDPQLDTRQVVADERDGLIFVGHRDNASVTELDGRTGAILRHVTTCGGPFAVALSVRTGHLFAKCNDGTTDMLDARSGQVLRHNSTNSGAYCSVVVDEATDRAIETGNVSADMLDARTGRIIRTWPQGSPLSFCSATAVDARSGRIYTLFAPAGVDGQTGLGGPHNQVAVLDGRTGATLRRIPVPTNANALAVDSATGHVLVDSVGALDGNDMPVAPGALSVLDGVTGRTLRTLQLGYTPADIAIDAPRRRALVVSSYSDMAGNGSMKAWRPRESWWPQALRRIKQVICCLPFQAPAPPAPTTNGTVTTLDLSRL